MLLGGLVLVHRITFSLRRSERSPPDKTPPEHDFPSFFPFFLSAGASDDSPSL